MNKPDKWTQYRRWRNKLIVIQGQFAAIKYTYDVWKAMRKEERDSLVREK